MVVQTSYRFKENFKRHLKASLILFERFYTVHKADQTFLTQYIVTFLPFLSFKATLQNFFIFETSFFLETSFDFFTKN